MLKNRYPIEAFFTETREAFHFLELEYDYQWLDEYIKYPNEWRDMVARSRYVSARVGLEVWWYLADAAIGVSFVELQQPGVFPSSVSFYPPVHALVPNAMNLFTLAALQGAHHDPDFLLNDYNKTRTDNKRAKLIDTKRKDILLGLARATQTYALPILKGDTSVFPAVMNYYLIEQKRLNPNFFIPGLKQLD